MYKIKNEQGAALSLTEMMIAVVVGAILMAGVIATLVSVIPWFQNEQAKTNLQSIVDIQEPHYIMFGKYFPYEDIAGVNSKYINLIDPALNDGDWFEEVPETLSDPDTHAVMRQLAPAELQQLRNPPTITPPAGTADDAFLLLLNTFVGNPDNWGDNIITITSGHTDLAGRTTHEYGLLNNNGCYFDNATSQLEPATELAGSEYFAYITSDTGEGYIKSSIIKSGRTTAVSALTNTEKILLSLTFPIRSDSPLVAEGFTPTVC